MGKKINLVAGLAFALAFSSSANAAITLTAVAGTNPYSGPAPTYDFETAAPIIGGGIQNGSTPGLYAQPFGSTGNYWTVGPSTSTPGILSLAAFGDISWISFIWGSVDSYNTLEVLDAANNVLETFTGSDVYNPANGDQDDPNTNPLVTLFFTGSDMSNAASLRLTSNTNAFEVDNFAVQAVPEPKTWGMMLLGFGAIGFAMRRSRKTYVRGLGQLA